MERNLSDSTNLLAEDWRPRVEAAWDCPLSAAQVSSLEVFCSLTVMHLRVDADTRADAFLGVLSPRVIADGEKRHKKMGRLARELREMVSADLSGGHKGYRLSLKTFPNRPLGGPEGQIALITFLERLQEEAKRPAPDQLLYESERAGRKRRLYMKAKRIRRGLGDYDGRPGIDPFPPPRPFRMHHKTYARLQMHGEVIERQLRQGRHYVPREHGNRAY